MPPDSVTDGRAGAVADHFGRIAPTYGGGEYYTRRREAVVGGLRDELARSRRILDLGCGNGRYLAEFRAIAATAFLCGADLSPEMLAEARARVGAGVSLVRAEALALPFRDSAFDLIFASHVFPFVTDIHGAVNDAARVLAPGGILIATAGRGVVGPSLRALMSEETWKRFAPAAFGGVQRIGAESEALHREAFRQARLRIETRRVRFAISWAGVEEWVRLRWLPFATEAEKAEVARAFSEIAAGTDRGLIALEERLLLGRR